MERRRSIRLIAEKALVALGRRTGELPGAGWPLRDISEGGLRFAVPADLPDMPEAGEAAVVTVELPEHPRPLKLTGTVRRAKGSAGSGEVEVSLEFTGLAQEERRRLREAVLDLAISKIGKKDAKILKKAWRAPEGPKLGDILIERQLISRGDLERFLEQSYEKDKPIGRQLVSRGLVPESAVPQVLAEQAGVPHVDLEVEGVDLLRVRRFTEDYLLRYLFVPLGPGRGRMRIAAASPLPRDIVADIERRYGQPVDLCIASERQVLSAIQKAFNISRNRRRSVRFAAGLPVRYKLYDGDWKPMHEEVLSGVTKNLSDSGVLFFGPVARGVSPEKLTGGGFFAGLHVMLPGQHEPVRVPCRIVRMTPVPVSQGEGRAADRPSGTYLYAVEVVGLSEEDRRRLNLFRALVLAPFGRRAPRGRGGPGSPAGGRRGGV